jgi:hypothetical protein
MNKVEGRFLVIVTNGDAFLRTCIHEEDLGCLDRGGDIIAIIDITDCGDIKEFINFNMGWQHVEESKC